MVFSISFVLWFRWIFNTEIVKGKHHKLNGYSWAAPDVLSIEILKSSMRQRFAGLFNKSAMQS
jgi:hypothetical protein